MGEERSTRFVEVDGRSVRVRVAGLDRARRGDPVIVLESGGSLPLETWDPIFERVAELAPVIAYDRGGTGESPWDRVPPTPEQVTTSLRQMLTRLGARPPYLLIGHSWGGALIRYHAGMHPSDIAGVLYIDPTDITLTERDQIAIFESFGAGESEYRAFTRMMQAAMASAPEAMRAEADVILSLLQSDPETRGLNAAPDVPTSVIVAGRVASPPRNLVPFDADAYALAMHARQVTRLATWVRAEGRFQVARTAGHMVHADEPDLVVDEVRHLLTMIRRASR